MTASLQAGMVTDGYTLYVLPKIQKTQVYLQISSSLANLLGMETAKSGGGTSGTVENGSANQIQVPILSNKEFNQRSRVATGETLVIAGFSSVRNQSVSDSPFGITPLGGQGAEHKNVETIVLITPTILPGNT